jgi:hypothetical protein
MSKKSDSDLSWKPRHVSRVLNDAVNLGAQKNAADRLLDARRTKY